MFSLQFVIEFLGTFAFAISGIRSASSKNFDWFGGYVVGLATAIGGGTIRDVMLGQVPFWMTNSIYLICTGAALLTFVMLKKLFTRLSKTWALFDTLGLALFTIAGIQKALTGVANLVPTETHELIQIPGIGKAKADKYGVEILSITRRYKRENP